MLYNNKTTLGLPFYVVSTPIGNYDDITIRALNILKSVDLIICEDTRVTGKLLKHFGINKSMMCYNEQNSGLTPAQIVKKLHHGINIALVCDAGTPLISDPGYKLVQALKEANIKLQVIPGVSSVVAAITSSFQPTDQFFFFGFLPTKEQAKIRALENISNINSTVIIFEAAKRLINTLKHMQSLTINRSVTVTRELTKTYEEIIHGNIIDTIEYYVNEPPKGEVIIVLGPPQYNKQDEGIENLNNQLLRLLTEMSLKDAVKLIADNSKLSKKIIYERALNIIGKK